MKKSSNTDARFVDRSSRSMVERTGTTAPRHDRNAILSSCFRYTFRNKGRSNGIITYQRGRFFFSHVSRSSRAHRSAAVKCGANATRISVSCVMYRLRLRLRACATKRSLKRSHATHREHSRATHQTQRSRFFPLSSSMRLPFPITPSLVYRSRSLFTSLRSFLNLPRQSPTILSVPLRRSHATPLKYTPIIIFSATKKINSIVLCVCYRLIKLQSSIVSRLRLRLIDYEEGISSTSKCKYCTIAYRCRGAFFL